MPAQPGELFGLALLELRRLCVALDRALVALDDGIGDILLSRPAGAEVNEHETDEGKGTKQK